ncbi:class C sortase [Olsenella uli]|uniref:class C sortase n=1 Tax=Olsenella uli TaxID=133926 RepID=UPI00195B9EC5|nr:class C sortase [Olsenella uli]
MKRVRLAIAAVAFVMGVGLIAYPYVSDYVYKQRQHEVISVQDQIVDEAGEQRLAEETDRAQDYNEQVAAGGSSAVIPEGSDGSAGSDEAYESLLNLGGDGVMGTLSIPKIDLRVPIYHYTDAADLQQGVGHEPGTSLPVGGPSTHAVLAGHNGLPAVKIFDRLDELKPGDYFVIETLGKELAYRVTSTETVLPDETESVAVQEGRDLVTLVTCVPYGVNSHRLLVHAERCELPAEWTERGAGAAGEPTAAEAAPGVPLTALTVAGIAVVAACALVARHVRRTRARRARGGRHFSGDDHRASSSRRSGGR